MQQHRIFRRWCSTNLDATSFASKIPTITEPTGDGILELTVGGILVPKRAKLLFIGLGADNDAASVRVIGWARCVLQGKIDLWIPTVIGEWACTFSAAVGIAGAAVLNTERFADTITPVAARTRDYVIAAGTSLNSDYQILSPVGDLVGHVIIPVAAFAKLEMTVDQTTNTPTVNALYSFLDDDE